MAHKVLLLLSAACLMLATAALAQIQVDPSLPEYKPVSAVAGNLKAVGSDTLNNMMTYWSEGFRTHYPNVKVSVEGKGSSTAPPALIEGTAQLGPMSREMKSKEIEDFSKKYGYPPLRAEVAVDSLAIFVHKDNPIKCLTLQQIDAIFSKTRKGGAPKEVKTWGDLGLTGDWADKPISLYGRNAASGTYGYFKEIALFKGDYKDQVKEQPGSSAVVQGVASDKYAMGYSGVGYKTPDVKTVPLADQSGKCFDANAENAYSGSYPLARFLYIYFNKKPNENLTPLIAEFIKFVFSKEGQQIVIKDGFYPVSKALAEESMKKAGLFK